MRSGIDRSHIFIPGEYVLDTLTLSSYNGAVIDLKPNMLELVLRESFDGPCITGMLKIGENVNLLRHIPLIGNETLTIKLTTPSKDRPIIQTFFVYGLHNKLEIDLNSKMLIYDLHFCSHELINTKQTKISRSYANLSYAEMAAAIFKEYVMVGDKELRLQPTLGKKHIVIPYMNPIGAIQWLASRSVSDDSKDCAFVFYETFDNFYFTTINYKITESAEPVAKYLYYKANESLGDGTFKNLTSDFRRIETYEILTMNDSIRNIENGVFASKLLTHDITKKTFTEQNFSYNDDFYQLDTINNYGILPHNGDQFSDKPYGHYRFYPKHSFAYDGVPNNDEYETYVLKRNAHINHFQTFKMTMLVAGDSDRRIGDIVDVKIRSQEVQDNEKANPFDPYYSGKYLITGITHIIQKAVHKMRLTLERDSIPQPYPDVKVIE